jgi:hypothetical protein
MKHYFSPKNYLYAYPLDGSQDEHIPADFVPATDAQVQAIQNPPPKPVDPKAAAKAQIDALELQQLMPRATREFMLLFAEANNLTTVPGYAPLKAFDNQIKDLRSRL